MYLSTYIYSSVHGDINFLSINIYMNLCIHYVVILFVFQDLIRNEFKFVVLIRHWQCFGYFKFPPNWQQSNWTFIFDMLAMELHLYSLMWCTSNAFTSISIFSPFQVYYNTITVCCFHTLNPHKIYSSLKSGKILF